MDLRARRAVGPSGRGGGTPSPVAASDPGRKRPGLHGAERATRRGDDRRLDRRRRQRAHAAQVVRARERDRLVGFAPQRGRGQPARARRVRSRGRDRRTADVRRAACVARRGWGLAPVPDHSHRCNDRDRGDPRCHARKVSRVRARARVGKAGERRAHRRNGLRRGRRRDTGRFPLRAVVVRCAACRIGNHRDGQQLVRPAAGRGRRHRRPPDHCILHADPRGHHTEASVEAVSPAHVVHAQWRGRRLDRRR
jgi:hypothetical protein